MSEEVVKAKQWMSQREGFQDSLKYMQGRMKGEIRSIKTPWPKFNDAGTDGIEWHTTTVIGGRPGSGKTLIKDQIIREAFTLNAGDDFRVLEFQFEMMARTSAIREYSSLLGASYKYLCSAEGGKIKIEDLEKCYAYAKEKVKYPIDIVEEACTVAQFVVTIKKYMEEHSTLENVNGVEERVYKKTIVTLDHTILMRKATYEKDKMETLYALGEALTALKRKYPIAFIVLSQLNRNMDAPERNEDGKYGNYILDSDFFGADAMLQHADIQIGLNRPAKQKIKFYGPDRFIIDDETVLVMHFLKCRNGNTRLSFFKTEFDKMRIIEMPTPPTASRNLKTS